MFGVSRLLRGLDLCLESGLGEDLTCDNLIKQGFTLVGWCCMCQCNGETIDHFYIHCDVVCDLWSLSFRTFGIGVIEEGGEPFFQVEKLVWEALFRDLECGTVMYDVDIVEEEK